VIHTTPGSRAERKFYPRMPQDFTALVQLARTADPAFLRVGRDECLSATKDFAGAQWTRIRQRHEAGESGSNVLRLLTDAADTIVCGITEFALSGTRNRRALLSRLAVCALGGYGRAELSPYSDLDLCLLYDTHLDPDIETLSAYLMPFLWDSGFQAGYAVHSVAEAAALARQDPQVFTSCAQARLLLGDTTTFARLKLLHADLAVHNGAEVLHHLRQRERAGE